MACFRKSIIFCLFLVLTLSFFASANEGKEEIQAAFFPLFGIKDFICKDRSYFLPFTKNIMCLFCKGLDTSCFGPSPTPVRTTPAPSISGNMGGNPENNSENERQSEDSYAK